MIPPKYWLLRYRMYSESALILSSCVIESECLECMGTFVLGEPVDVNWLNFRAVV